MNEALFPGFWGTDRCGMTAEQNREYRLMLAKQEIEKSPLGYKGFQALPGIILGLTTLLSSETIPAIFWMTVFGYASQKLAEANNPTADNLITEAYAASCVNVFAHAVR